MRKKIGVILMTYGSPATIDDVPEFLTRVYRGKTPAVETIAEFKRRYALIGGSPLIHITDQQAMALERELNSDAENSFKVVAGMRFSEPFIDATVKSKLLDVDTIIGIIMSPQYSPIIMQGYVSTLTNVVKSLDRRIPLAISQDWHLQHDFITALATRVTEALNKFPEEDRAAVPILFSAHSMPKRVIDSEPDYIVHLHETAEAVAHALQLPATRWQFCYQSAGHTPEEWLKPDFADLMPELAKKGEKNVLIAPIQFLSDHLEILYDIEVGAREQAEKYGITFARTKSLNIHPLFIHAMVQVVNELIPLAI